MITPGPDGDLWFTESGLGKLGRVNPTTKVITEYPLASTQTVPIGIVTGPDGDLWFTESGTSMIGRINPTTFAITEFPTPTPGASPQQITVGPDGNLWFSETFADSKTSKVGFINPTTGASADFAANADSGIAAGPDGSIWFTGTAANTIGEINPATDVITEYPGPTAPTAIVTGPDGDLYATAQNGFDQVVLIPATSGVIRSSVDLDPTGAGSVSGATATGFASQTVFLDLKGDGFLDPGDPATVTNAQGQYTFSGLAPGTYTLRLALYPGNMVTTPTTATQTVVVTRGQLTTPPIFGVAPTGSTAPIGVLANPFGTGNPNVSTAEVVALYQTLLGRTPDASGEAFYVGVLQGGVPLSVVHSTEYDTRAIVADYANFLNHAATPAEVSAWLTLVQGGLSLDQVADDFLSSDVFSALHPTDDSFIAALYADVLGFNLSVPELTFWRSALASGTSRSQAASIFLTSDAYESRAVGGIYTAFLGRAADASGLAFYMLALRSGTSIVDVIADISSSTEFVRRANASLG